jgi:phage repressor protein C with HTH and peptisase S24 domain
MEFTTGGKEVVHRLLEAYGFRTRQALCDQFGVSKSTMASRYSRDIFPADWVIQAVIETGVNIEWLAFGRGVKYSNENHAAKKIPSVSLEGGVLSNGELLFVDKELFPDVLRDPHVLFIGNGRYIVDLAPSDIVDGLWLVEIDGKASLREIMRLPQQRIRVSSESGTFDCHINDIKLKGHVALVMRKESA